MSVKSYKVIDQNQEIFKNLNEFRKTRRFCDATFIVGGRKIFAHKVVLSAASQYFRLMFGNNFQESSSSFIPMQGIDYLALRDVLEYIYTSKIELNEGNIFNIMEAVDILQLYTLRPYINHYLKSNLNFSNCLSIYAMAKFRDYDDASSMALKYAVEHFDQILEQKDYMDLPVDVWQKILGSDVINVPNELCLLDALITWYEHSPSERLESVNYLSSFINFTKIQAIDLQPIIESKCLQGTEVLIRITAAIECLENNCLKHGSEFRFLEQYHADYSDKMGSLNYAVNFKNERFPKYNSIMLLVGGQSTSSPECYLDLNQHWSFRLPIWGPYKPHDESQLIIPDTPPMSKSATANNDHEMFILGGYMEEDCCIANECYRYNVLENRWTQLSPLPVRLMHAAAAFCNGRMYITGGQNQNLESVDTVMYYHEQPGKLGRWVQVSPMLEKRAGHQLCSINGALYALGGDVRSAELEDQKECQTLLTVEKYSPFADSWHYVADMINSRTTFACAAHEEQIYVFGGKGDDGHPVCAAEKYDTMTDLWRPIIPMPFISRTGCSCVLFKGRLYILCGVDSRGIREASAHALQPGSERWQYTAPTHFAREHASVAVLQLPEHPERKSEAVRKTQQWV